MTSTPADIARIRELLTELAPLLVRMTADLGQADLAPACWFTANTLVCAELLRGARRRGSIRAERVQGRWHYSRTGAERLWPDFWCHPKTGLYWNRLKADEIQRETGRTRNV